MLNHIDYELAQLGFSFVDVYRKLVDLFHALRYPPSSFGMKDAHELIEWVERSRELPRIDFEHIADHQIRSKGISLGLLSDIDRETMVGCRSDDVA